MAKDQRRSVVVVGGGPAGLATAIGLRTFGVDCLLVERHPSTLNFPKGRGISVRSMEIFRQWGVEPELTEKALPRGESLHVFMGDSLLAESFTRLTQPPEDAPPSPTDRLICAQTSMEEVLRARATALGADLRFGTSMTSFEQDSEGVTVHLSGPGSEGPLTLRTDWLIAADGHDSPIRNALGIERSGPGVVAHAVSVLVGADVADRMQGRRSVIYRIADVPDATLLAVDNAHDWLLIYGYDPAETSAADLTDDRCLELARRAIGDPTVPVRLLGTRFWASTALVANDFRRDRVLLVSDAAHVTTTLGGLGMNCGIADVHNVTWKLAGVINGWADPSLLDTFHAERHPVAVATAQASLGASRPPAPTKGIDLGYRYTSSVITSEDTDTPHVSDPVGDYVPSGAPGCRAPHLWLDQAQTRSTLDLFGAFFTWLIDGTAAEPLAVAEGSDVPLRMHVLHDHAWRKAYGLQPGGAVLVRPDGHVAWRGPMPNDADAHHILLNALVLRVGSDFAVVG